MCASPLRGAAVPVFGTAEEPCVCRRFASDIFFRSCPFFPSVIRAEAALTNASTGIGLLRLRMEHRMKSVVTVQTSGVK
jgi:hypothetical protein